MGTTAKTWKRGERAVMRRWAWEWLGALTLGGAVPLPVGAVAAPYTGTGGGPETTVNAPYRAGSGQTVPPERDAAPEADPTERTPRQKRLDGVLDSICEACRDIR